MPPPSTANNEQPESHNPAVSAPELDDVTRHAAE